MKSFAATLLLAVATAATALPSDYTFRDGYYWQGGQRYSRQLVSRPNGCGGYCQSYSYSLVPAEPAVVADDNDDYRSQIIELLRQELKSRSEEESRYQEDLQFQQLLQQLQPLLRPSTTSSYSIDRNLGSAGYSIRRETVQRSTPIVQQGSTLYGYGYQNSRGDKEVDVGVVLGQSRDLASQAHTLAGNAVSDFNSLVNGEAERQGASKTERQRLEAALQLLQAAKDPPAQTETQTTVTLSPSEESTTESVEVQRSPTGVSRSQASVIVTARCVRCHGGDHKLDLRDYDSLSWEDKSAVVSSVTTRDPARLMPRSGDNMGTRLPQAEIKVLLQDLNTTDQ